MGTDIHAAIEYRDREGSAWKCVTTGTGENQHSYRLDLDRNYDMFAILANVRNGRGFAACDTGDGFTPMSDCRGVPADISDEALSVLSEEHSATWVTLREILTYDWTAESRKRGFVSALQFFDWEPLKDWCPAPSSWCGAVSGPDVVVLSPEEMKAKIDSIRGSADERKAVSEKLAHHYCRIEWPVSYAEAGRQIWLRILPLMLKFGVRYGHDNIYDW